VIIAVHDPRRDVGRAVASALTSTGVARVLVICHNTPVEGIAERVGRLVDDSRVELHPLTDGTRSPAGPFNHGLDLATGRFTAVMGSDDEVAIGAIDDWLGAAARYGADVVVPRLRYAGGRRVPTPPTRPCRRGRLDGVRDRLAYRTAPLGLVSRARFGGLRFTPSLTTGEDLRYSVRLWFGGARVAGAARAAEYLIHDDAVRVTFARRTLAEEFAAVFGVVADEWVTSLPMQAREALAVKLWRISVFGAVHYRAGAWTTEDREVLAEVCEALTRLAPRAVEVLSRADDALIDAIADPAIAPEIVDARSRARRRFVSPAALMSARLSRAAAREAPVRFAAATWLASRG